MKIIILSGADSIHTVRWTNAYASMGHSVHLVTMPDHIVRKDKLNNNVTIHYLKYPSPYGYFINAIELNRLCKKIDPDVINVHFASGYGTLARWAHIHPYVLSVWGSDVYDVPYQSRLKHYIVKRNLLNADALASTSYAMTLQTKKVMGDNSIQIAVTPFGVNINEFSPNIAPTPKNDNIFLFGTIKKLTYKYGIDYIIKGFDIFLKEWKANGSQGKEPRLYICGKGANKQDFIALRDSLGLADYVEIEGYIAHELVASKIRSFDVSCFGSELDSESFGVSAVESMACSVPVIATDVDGFKEVIVDGETGYIVPRKNAQAIAEKMKDLYYDSVKRDTFGKNGRARVEKLYNWDDNVLLLEGELKKIAKKR